MGLLSDAQKATRTPETDDDTDDDPAGDTGRDDGTTQHAGEHRPRAGEEIELERPETTQPTDGGNWLTGAGKYGRPRKSDALQMRQIVQTSAMQSIVNGVAGQLLGGDLAFEGRDEVLDEMSDSEMDAASELRSLSGCLEGPHVPKLSLDQLIVSAVEDMMGPGQAVWKTLQPSNADLPVAALQELDPLTIRMNVDEKGFFEDPPYWQASGAFSGQTISAMDNVEPVPLQHEDVIVLDYPYGTRSYRTYPVSPAWQVREWLEILANYDPPQPILRR